MHRFKFIALLTVAVAALLFLSVPRTARAANQVVNNCDNDAELRADIAAIQTDPSGGILSFNCGTKTILLTGGVLPLIKTYTAIDGGNKITLSGTNASRIFYVDAPGSLNLYNITLTRGASTGDGGAIYNLGTVSVNSSKLLDNSAGASGGAIVSYGPLHIVASEFARNKAANGGAIYPRFAAAVTTISASSIHHNEATDPTVGWGGGMLLWDGAPATVTNTTFDSNKAVDGGAVYVFFHSSLSLDSSTLKSNQAVEGSGGGIYNEGTVTVINSTLSSNSAKYGGGIDNYLNGNFSFTNSTFSGNSAWFGGAIGNTKGNGALTNVTIVGNSASYKGGGINNGTYAGDGIYVKNILVADNPGGNCDDTNYFTINSFGSNLSSDNTCTQFFDQVGDSNNVNALLGGLAANGGATMTHLPLANSPALDGGTSSGAPATDQRGIPRPQGAAVDIGAVEACAKPAKPTLLKPAEGKKVKKVEVPLDWSDSVCTSTYKVQIKLGATSGPNAYVKSGLTASADTTTPLAKGQTYYWRVTAMGPGGKAKSPWQSFRVK